MEIPHTGMLTLGLEISSVVDSLTSHIHVVLTLKNTGKSTECVRWRYLGRGSLCMIEEWAFEGFIKTFLSQRTE